MVDELNNYQDELETFRFVDLAQNVIIDYLQKGGYFYKQILSAEMVVSDFKAKLHSPYSEMSSEAWGELVGGAAPYYSQ